MRSGVVDCSAGISPATTPAASVTTREKTITRQWSGALAQCVPGKRSVRRSFPPHAAAMSAAPPAAAASSTLSVTSNRMSRTREMPSASRTAISRRRVMARARSRFTTLAMAMSRTSSATPPRRAAMRISCAGAWGPRARMIEPSSATASESAGTGSSSGRRRTSVRWPSSWRTDTPGRGRTSTWKPFRFLSSHHWLRPSPHIAKGSHTSTASRSTPVNPGGATPMIVTPFLPRSRRLPSTSLAPFNRFRQKASLTTATSVGAPSRSSLVVKKRPRSGCTPSTPK